MYLFNRREDIYTNLEEMDGYFSEQGVSKYLKAIVAVILFIISFIILRLDITNISLGDISVEGNSFKGIVAHTQLLISVYLVIETINKGYLIAIGLNSLAIIITIRSIIMDSNYSALPAVTNFTIIIYWNF
ncbi:MAG: hypothetical protein ACLFUI_10580, partial [Halanaerobiales bacterium]